MRDYYFDTPLDLGSSGVQNFSFAQLRNIIGIGLQELDATVFDDSLTLGALSLRTAIARRWGDGNPENVMVANGSNDVSFLLMMSLLRAGDEVVVIDPIYHTLVNIAATLGCRLKTLPLRWEDGFEPDIDALIQLITPQTRMVVVNFPHNPTGATISRTQQRRLLDAVGAVGAFLVWDAAFEELVHEGESLPNPFLHYERAIAIGTLSKAYGLAGIRIGWCIGARRYFENAVLWKDYTSLYVSPWLEVVAQQAVEHADQLLAIRMRQVRTNLTSLRKWIPAQAGRVTWAPPKGGVTAFVCFPGVSDSEHFCRGLAAEKGVMLVPGTAFKHPRHARLGFGGPVAEFQEGLHRLTEYLSNYNGSP